MSYRDVIAKLEAAGEPTHVITAMVDGRELAYSVAYDRQDVELAVKALGDQGLRAMPVPYATWLARGLDTGGRL